MVKGVSRQVILVRGSGDGLFDQAIFILKDSAVQKGITDDDLMKEAKQAIRTGRSGVASGPLWACGGAVFTALVWLVTVLI